MKEKSQENEALDVLRTVQRRVHKRLASHEAYLALVKRRERLLKKLAVVEQQMKRVTEKVFAEEFSKVFQVKKREDRV